MLDPRITFKNRFMAGVLAFLIPGAGHVYQGRYFKGLLCGLCILATFFFGMSLGDWSVVYWKRDPLNYLNPYYAQVFVGLPALPSLIQSRRYESRENNDRYGINRPLEVSYKGVLRIQEPSAGLSDGNVVGQLAVEPDAKLAEGRGIRGEFTGRLIPESGESRDVKLSLGDMPKIGKPVSADPDRIFDVDVIDQASSPPRNIGRLQGTIPRSFWDQFEAPPDDEYFLDLHRNLGKFYELAMTFTMIAGLLNILVILDAVEGPAYGYGDSDEQSEPQQDNSAIALTKAAGT